MGLGTGRFQIDSLLEMVQYWLDRLLKDLPPATEPEPEPYGVTSCLLYTSDAAYE